MITDKSMSLQTRMEAILTDGGFQRELGQVRAKATLQAIGENEEGPRWTYIANRFSRNSAAALYALEDAILTDPDCAVQNEGRSRQLALAWESLARLNEGVARPTALLNAALAYELAGYQANAAYLAKEVLPEPHLDSRADAQTLVASFIQRRLIVTAQIANHLLEFPPDPSLPLDTLSIEVGEAVLADGLAKACRFFLSGDLSAYRQAEELLSEATKVFGELGAPIQSNLAYGVRAVLPLMKQRSTWHQLKPHFEESEVWKRYLTLLARPLSRGVTELWPSQTKVLESGFLGSKDSTVIRLPTSGGKTRIAEMAIIDTLQQNPDSKCVFVAPYRALAFEVERTLGAVMSDLGYRVSSVIGSYESDEFEQFLLGTADLLIVTPEKLDLVLRLRPEIAAQIMLVVLDEVHIMDDANRGIKFELLLSRMKKRLPTSRYLVMSAVVPDSTLKDFATWLANHGDNSVSSDWRPTVQRIARFEWLNEKGVVRFEKDPSIPDLESFIPGALRQRNYSYTNPETQRPNRRQYPKQQKGDTAAELAYNFSEQGPVLVFCTQPNWVESVCKAIISKSIQYRRLTREAIFSHFTGMDSTRSVELAREWLGEDHIATRALAQGIALHHGRLPDVVREAIETDCRDGRYRVIVATNTLAQGVNMPVRTVIIHSTWRADEEGRRSRIPVRDYWNVVGRAGRAGMETEGLIIHITLNDQDRRDFNHYTKNRSPEPVSGALYQLLQQLVSSRVPNEAQERVAATLDPEILAIAVEEGIETFDSDEWSTYIEETYAAQLAVARNVDMTPLVESARLAAKSIFDRAPVQTWRRVFAQTGLSSSSCESLREFVETHEEDLRSLLCNAAYDDIEHLNRLVLSASLHLSEAQTATDFGGDPQVLLDSWIGGESIGDIVESMTIDEDSVEQVSRYIEELFGYRLPWIISALFRISMESLCIQDSELSNHIRCYTSMVKHGLPDPIATWAMSAGITRRDVARRLAEAFQMNHSEVPSQDSFVTWLSHLTEDSLRHDYEISGHVLDELKYKLGRVAVNRLLRPIEPLSEMLPTQASVAGVNYDSRKLAARTVRTGDILELQRDYDNPVDSNAVAVHHKAGRIGFLPRHLAQRLAPEIDAGSTIVATAKGTKNKNQPEIIVELSLA